MAPPPGLRALIIFNPAAGQNLARRQAQLERLERELRGGGWETETATTDVDGGAEPAAERGLRQGFQVLIGCGGDGTLNEIAHVIASQGGGHAPPMLAVAPPFGTANIFANAVGCPRHPVAAARWLLAAAPQWRALGTATTPARQRHFLVVASAGYDAAIVRDVAPGDKRRWGKLAFAASAVVAWRDYFPAPLDYTVAADPAAAGTADGIILGLTPIYGGTLRLGQLGPQGTIALALRGAPEKLAGWALHLTTRGLAYAPGVERLADGEIGITTAGVPLELDGEPAGNTPVSFSVRQRALQCLY